MSDGRIVTKISDGNGGTMEIKIPLEEWVEHIVERTIKRAAPNLQAVCPVAQKLNQINEDHQKLDRIYYKFSFLIGCMVGSGIIGGGLGAYLAG